MQSTLLYLNDQVADLSQDSPMALSFAINNLADVKNQNGNTSNQFKLPLTQNNRRILGFPDDIRITTDIPYTQLRAKIVQDGIEIVPFGLAEITDADENNASITIISGNVDFFDAITEQIYDMGDSTKLSGANKPFLPYQHIWNLATAAGSQRKTDGYIYPVINYGLLSPLAPFTVDVRQLRPAFFLKTAIDLIIGETGYKSQGNILADPLYNKIIIPFAGDQFNHGTDYQTQPDALGMIAQNPIDINVSHEPIYDADGILSFTQELSDPKNQFDGTRFTAQQVFTATVLVTIPRFYFRGRKNDEHPSNVDILINYDSIGGGSLQYPLNYDLTDFTRVPGTSGSGLQGYWEFGLMKLSADIDMEVGDSITVRYQFKGDRPAYFNLYAGASITIKAKNEQVLFGQEIQCERIFPDISQKDLLKDTLQRFGIICQTDNTNKTVTFATFKDIVANIPVAKDWTAKCKNIGKNNTFKLGDYAQVNNLKYKEDDVILTGIPQYFADDVINIANKNLPATVDLFTSQFAPSLNTPFANNSVANILKIADGAIDPAFTQGVSPRILVDQKLSLVNDTGWTNVTFTDGVSNVIVNDVISAPYFHKPNGAFSLMWKDADNQPGLRSLYYKELERILKTTKKVVRFFILTPRDILELDFLIPIYLEQDNAYFYINSISAWRKGQPTKCELVKIGEIQMGFAAALKPL